MFTDRVKIIPAVLKFPPQKKVTGMVTFDHFKEHLFLNEFHLLFTFRGGEFKHIHPCRKLSHIQVIE